MSDEYRTPVSLARASTPATGGNTLATRGVGASAGGSGGSGWSDDSTGLGTAGCMAAVGSLSVAVISVADLNRVGFVVGVAEPQNARCGIVRVVLADLEAGRGPQLLAIQPDARETRDVDLRETGNAPRPFRGDPQRTGAGLRFDGAIGPYHP